MQVQVKYLQNNRERIFETIKDNSFVIIHSGAAPFKSADASYPFYVNRNFFYLTGINQEDVTLVIGKLNGEKKELLFIDENDPILVKWVGAKLYKKEASELSGIPESNILYNSSFNNFMNNYYQSLRYSEGTIENLYLDLEQHNTMFYNTFGLTYANNIQKKFPAIKIENIYNTIVGLRMFKNSDEIEIMKNSINTTKEAIYNVMNHHNELDNEMVAEAYHSFILHKNAKVESFGSIVAAGKNAATLHYEDNNMPIEKDSLLLMDVGCFTNNYSSDITRTIPVSGKFTTRQKEVYEVVLDCNKKCIEYAKAGMSWLELNNYAKKLLAAGCKKLGLIKEDQELSKYYFHSIGHSLGLDVHDPNIASKGLQEGMVITIEPGLYIPEENIGIRIEDNIVITCDKAINLSKDIIKEVEDIEKYMNK